MVKVVDLKHRTIERLEAYRVDAKALPALCHARYAPKALLRGHMPPKKLFSYSFRKHKPHQMHSQHRDSCVDVLQFLIKRLDVVTRQCLFINPKQNIRRTIYIPEIARHTSLCERTVTRVMDSLTRAGYIIRTAIGNTNQRYKYYISESLFRDLKLDVSYKLMSSRLTGLAKKASISQGSNSSKKAYTASPKKAIAPSPSVATQQPIMIAPGTDRDKSVGNHFLAALTKRRRPPPS